MSIWTRDFVDFSRALPVSSDYDRVRAALLPPVPAAWPDAGRELAALREALGPDRFERRFPAASTRVGVMFYGGTGATWSRRALESLFDNKRRPGTNRGRRLSHRASAVRYGGLICDYPARQYRRDISAAWVVTASGACAGHIELRVPKEGLVDYAWQRGRRPGLLRNAEVRSIPSRVCSMPCAPITGRTHTVRIDARRCPQARPARPCAALRPDPEAAPAGGGGLRGRQVLRQAKAGLMEDRER